MHQWSCYPLTMFVRAFNDTPSCNPLISTIRIISPALLVWLSACRTSLSSREGQGVVWALRPAGEVAHICGKARCLRAQLFVAARQQIHIEHLMKSSVLMLDTHMSYGYATTRGKLGESCVRYVMQSMASSGTPVCLRAVIRHESCLVLLNLRLDLRGSQRLEYSVW